MVVEVEVEMVEVEEVPDITSISQSRTDADTASQRMISWHIAFMN